MTAEQTWHMLSVPLRLKNSQKKQKSVPDQLFIEYAYNFLEKIQRQE